MTTYPMRILLLVGILLGSSPSNVRAQDQAAQAYEAAYNFVIDEAWSPAADALRVFIRQYGGSSWVDDAQFWLCYVNEKISRDMPATFDCYYSFVKEYEDSQWADDARANVVRIGRELVRSGKREYQALVASMQEAGNEDVKLVALEALWQMGDERALAALLELYDKEGQVEYKKKMIFALSQFDAPAARDKLKDIARHDGSPSIRKEAIFWISQHDPQTAVSLLEEIAKDEKSIEVQKQIAFAYAQLGEEGLPRLLAIARQHPSMELRKEAVFWLSQTEDARVIGWFGDLMDTVEDEELLKRILFAYGQLDNGEATVQLLKVAKSHKNMTVRKEAVFWLAQQDGPEAVRALDELASASTEPEMLKKIIFSYSQMDDEIAIPRLVKMVQQHQSEQVRKDALFWLSQSDSPEALALLDDMMDTADLEIQKQIVIGFSRLGGDQGVTRLIKIAKTHKHPQVRKDAIFWLGQSDDPRAQEALLEIVRGQ